MKVMRTRIDASCMSCLDQIMMMMIEVIQMCLSLYYRCPYRFNMSLFIG